MAAVYYSPSAAAAGLQQQQAAAKLYDGGGSAKIYVEATQRDTHSPRLHTSKRREMRGKGKRLVQEKLWRITTHTRMT